MDVNFHYFAVKTIALSILNLSMIIMYGEIILLKKFQNTLGVLSRVKAGTGMFFIPLRLVLHL